MLASKSSIPVCEYPCIMRNCLYGIGAVIHL